MSRVVGSEAVFVHVPKTGGASEINVVGLD